MLWVDSQNLCADAGRFAGVLAGLDGFMNIAMEQTEEYVGGQLKNKYGDCFIRGNNGARFCLACVICINTSSYHAVSFACYFYTVLYISSYGRKV